MPSLLLIYCLLIAAASIAGGLAPRFFRLDHRQTQMVLSLVAGVMLAVAVLHLMPHAVQELDEVHWAFGAALAGLLFMFFLLRLFNFHQHDTPCETDECEDEHHDHRAHEDISWMGLAIGLGIHTLIDGVALAVAFKSEAIVQIHLPAVGIFLAVLLHKPLDALSITALMKARNVNGVKQWMANIGFAMLCPLGAVLCFLGLSFAGDAQGLVLGVTLGFTAGVFICISLSDLLPEVQFHSHDRFALSGMLILGIAIAVGLEILPGR